MKNVIFGTMASLIGILAFLPLVYSTTVNKTTNGLTYKWLLLGILSQSCWLIYGVPNRIIPIMMSGFFLLSTYIYLAFIKHYYEKNGMDAQTQLKMSCNKKLNELRPSFSPMNYITE